MFKHSVSSADVKKFEAAARRYHLKGNLSEAAFWTRKATEAKRQIEADYEHAHRLLFS